MGVPYARRGGGGTILVPQARARRPRMALAGGGEIGPEAILLPGQLGAGPATHPTDAGGDGRGGAAALVGRRADEVGRDLILGTLHHTLGNRTHAAGILGISIRTLRNKLRQYGAEGVAITPPPGGEAAERAAV